MDRLIAPNSVPFAGRDIAPLTGTPEYATDGNLFASPPEPPTLWPAWAWNMIMDEIMAVIAAANVTPDRTNWAQLLQAIQVLLPVSAADTGTANAMAITLTPTPASLAALTGRLFIITKGAANNTGAITLTVNGFGPTPVVTAAGIAFSGNQWPAGANGLVEYNGTHWVVLNTIAQFSSGAWTYVAAPQTIAPGAYIADTRAGSFTLTLEAVRVQGDNYEIKDQLGSFGAHPLTIDPNGATIAGIAGQWTCNVPGAVIVLINDGGNYTVEMHV